MTRAGLSPEPTVPRIVATGVDLVTFSGDKLLGGPQAGLLLGSEEVIHRITRSPLMRALRCDKLTLAALEATLRLYLEEKSALHHIPTLCALMRSLEEIEALARKVARNAARPGLELTVMATSCERSAVISPTEELPSFAVRVQAAAALPRKWRVAARGEPAIFGRIARDALPLDMRTVSDQEADEVASALSRLTRPPDAECRGGNPGIALVRGNFADGIWGLPERRVGNSGRAPTRASSRYRMNALLPSERQPPERRRPNRLRSRSGCRAMIMTARPST